MNTSGWPFIVGIIGSLASVVCVIVLLVHRSKVRLVALLGCFGLAFVGFYLACRAESPLDLRISTVQGTSELRAVLDFLSKGPATVTIEPQALHGLRGQRIRIYTPPLRNVRLQYVVEQTLIPQLPGEWTYSVSGMVVTLRRR